MDKVPLVDDAQSCSCNLSDFERVTEFHDFDDGGGDDDDLGYIHQDNYDDHDDDHHDKEEEEEEEEEAIDQDCVDDDKAVPPSTVPGLVTARKHKKLRACVVDSTVEPINEIDKSRLFWETCLAS
ncbi:hypothetical protein F0562_000902 [Nyssa sinensis]|uniref:Uncharacterized protein n=1 Tax=Nyssa sinensis TaxID=561372 RepID=A0A5J5C1S7_9ASTE|nr:hypothetical protein F0562_000902 [Nyssa sinensis]